MAFDDMSGYSINNDIGQEGYINNQPLIGANQFDYTGIGDFGYAGATGSDFGGDLLFNGNPLEGAGSQGGNWMDSITGMFGDEGLFNSDTLKGFGSIAGGIGGIMGAMNASDQLDLAKDQFGFQQDFANRNVANQAKVINNKITSDQLRYLNNLKGNDDTQAGFDRNKAQADKNVKDKTVDGSAIN